MIVKEQKQIIFKNDCEAIVDYNELEKAIVWYAKKPVASVKHIYMHGRYPTVSIYKTKIHIHRLLMMYWLNCDIPINYHVHHMDGDKLNASKENLSLVFGRVHSSNHNKGKILTKKHKQQIAEANRLRKGKRRRYTRDISARAVYDLKKQGMTFNQISKVLELDWGCVKQRYEDFIHDNPDLLEVAECHL